MAYVPPEEILKAKQMDLLTYLQNYEPHELVRLSPNTYCTREHDSLKISNGKWHWFSRGVGGRTALDFLIKVRGYTFLQAVEAINRKDPAPQPTPRQRSEQARSLLLPESNGNNRAVTRYLTGRGIHPAIIEYCIKRKLLYESRQYHNAVFVGYDKDGIARYAALRGTMSSYKGDATGSDKRYAFSIAPDGDTQTVHVFESAIDLLSYATMELMEGRDWKRDVLLSLAGVYKTNREKVVPIALERFLRDYSHVKKLYLHLDNDEVGRSASAGIIAGLSDHYQVFDVPPSCGKDVNEQLQIQLNLNRRKETHER